MQALARARGKFASALLVIGLRVGLRVGLGLGLALGAAGCSNGPPFISMLTYSPNAGFTGQMTTIDGMVNYTDGNNDISQWMLELVDPSGALALRTPPTPIADTSAGVQGSVEFNFVFTPAVSGNYSFYFWIIDLEGRQSNHLYGPLRIADDTSSNM